MKRFTFFGFFTLICFANLFGQWNLNRYFPHFTGGSVGTVAIRPHDNAYVSSDWGAYSFTKIEYHPSGIGARNTYYLYIIDEFQDTIFLVHSIDSYDVKNNQLFPLKNENILYSIRSNDTYSYISKITKEGVLSSIGTFANGNITSFDAIDQNHLYFLFQSYEMETNPFIFMTQMDYQIQYRDTFYTKTPLKIDIPSENTGYMSARDHATGSFQILKSNYPFSQWDCMFDAGNTQIRDLRFYNTKIGYAILETGIIIKTRNGGVDWDTVYSNENQTLNQLNPISEELVFVCGNNGLIIKSINGGLHWSMDETNTTENLTRIFVFNPYRGYSTSLTGCYKMNASQLSDSTQIHKWVFGPNPNQGTINISSKEVVRKVEIFSIDGKLLYMRELNDKDFTINFSPNESGIHILKLTFEDRTESAEKIFFEKGK